MGIQTPMDISPPSNRLLPLPTLPEKKRRRETSEERKDNIEKARKKLKISELLTEDMPVNTGKVDDAPCPIYKVHESLFKPLFFDFLPFSDLYRFIRSNRRAWVAWFSIETYHDFSYQTPVGLREVITEPRKEVMLMSLEREDVFYLTKLPHPRADSVRKEFENNIHRQMSPHANFIMTYCCSERKYRHPRPDGTTDHGVFDNCHGCPWRAIYNYLKTRAIRYPEHISRFMWILGLEHQAHAAMTNGNGFRYVDKYFYLNRMSTTRMIWLWLKLRQVGHIIRQNWSWPVIPSPPMDTLYFGLCVGWRPWCQIKKMYLKDAEEKYRAGMGNPQNFAGVNNCAVLPGSTNPWQHTREVWLEQERMWQETFVEENQGHEIVSKEFNYIEWLNTLASNANPVPPVDDNTGYPITPYILQDLMRIQDVVERHLQFRLVNDERSIMEKKWLPWQDIIARRLWEGKKRLEWMAGCEWFDLDGEPQLQNVNIPQVPHFMKDRVSEWVNSAWEEHIKVNRKFFPVIKKGGRRTKVPKAAE